MLLFVVVDDDNSTYKCHKTTVYSHTDDLFLATTPFQRPDSPEYLQGHGGSDPFDPNYMSLHAEQQEAEQERRLSDGTLEEDE